MNNYINLDFRNEELNPNYTFESFIVNDVNQKAFLDVHEELSVVQEELVHVICSCINDGKLMVITSDIPPVGKPDQWNMRLNLRLATRLVINETPELIAHLGQHDELKRGAQVGEAFLRHVDALIKEKGEQYD